MWKLDKNEHYWNNEISWKWYTNTLNHIQHPLWQINKLKHESMQSSTSTGICLYANSLCTVLSLVRFAEELFINLLSIAAIFLWGNTRMEPASANNSSELHVKVLKIFCLSHRANTEERHTWIWLLDPQNIKLLQSNSAVDCVVLTSNFKLQDGCAYFQTQPQLSGFLQWKHK